MSEHQVPFHVPEIGEEEISAVTEVLQLRLADDRAEGAAV
jgi:hypothetical protein